MFWCLIENDEIKYVRTFGLSNGKGVLFDIDLYSFRRNQSNQLHAILLIRSSLNSIIIKEESNNISYDLAAMRVHSLSIYCRSDTYHSIVCFARWLLKFAFWCETVIFIGVSGVAWIGLILAHKVNRRVELSLHISSNDAVWMDERTNEIHF